jgi:hypothetical protein
LESDACCISPIAIEGSSIPKCAAVGDPRPRSAISGSSAFSTSRAVEAATAADLVGDAVEPQLVDLKQPELAVDPAAAAGGGEQRRGDTAGHVRALAVVDEREPCPLEH